MEKTARCLFGNVRTKLTPKTQEAKDGLAKAYTKKLQRSSPKEIGKILIEALEIFT